MPRRYLSTTRPFSGHAALFVAAVSFLPQSTHSEFVANLLMTIEVYMTSTTCEEAHHEGTIPLFHIRMSTGATKYAAYVQHQKTRRRPRTSIDCQLLGRRALRLLWYF